MTTPSASELFVVDSSGWIEFLGDGPKAGDFAPYFDREESILLPTIVVYEVCKKLLKSGVANPERFLSQALRKKNVELDAYLAQAAAKVSMDYHLAMADAIIYATTLASSAGLITSDQHFQGLPGVTLL